MEFKEFNALLKRHFHEMSSGEQYLFVTDVTPDDMWDVYMESFPPGTNEVFRERREFDCACCKQFIRAFGNVVAIKGLKAVSIWDFDVLEPKYKAVTESMSEFVKSKPVRDVFLPIARAYGTEKNLETKDSKNILTWHHFQIQIPESVKRFKEIDVGTVRGRMRDVRNVLKRSFKELSTDSIDTVLDLIAQKSLYKGEEWQKPLQKFRLMHEEFHQMEFESDQENYCWVASIEAGEAISKIKNHSIGVLLTDLSGDMDLNDAVRRYESIVAPTNYKRPKAIFTKKMVEKAKATVEKMGFGDSLGRRFATLEDITVNNILFANRDAMKQMSGDVFEDLTDSVPDKPKNFEKVEEVAIETFIKDVLPTAKEIEVLLENSHKSNMMSLLAPKVPDSKTMFKWNNGFSWAYAGNITDSMKERVKSFGGKVDGVLRFSIQWNDNDDNPDDLDAHCVEPNRNRIYFSNKRSPVSGGELDVDIISPDGVAVENITWQETRRMTKGKYEFMVHCYTSRGAKSGFTAEIEFNNRIFSFAYPRPLRQGEYINVADVSFDGKEFKMVKEHLTSSETSVEIWNLYSNKFHPVSACMYSPNYWDDQKGIGHRHYFFLLKGCRNDENPNGFFNEFLNEELMPHKRVFEALGSKMRVEDSENQLSGLGFSSTKRASLVCRVKGSFERVIRLTF